MNVHQNLAEPISKLNLMDTGLALFLVKLIVLTEEII